MLIVWAIVALVVLVAGLLIYMEHEWGFVLGGSTAVILAVSYLLAGFVARSPIVSVLPQNSRSEFDVMAVTAVVLMALAIIVIAYLAGRRSGARKKP